MGTMDHDNTEPRLPEGLKEALVQSATNPGGVPRTAELDRAVLTAVREEFAARRRRRHLWRWAGPVAAAAGLALAVVLVWPVGRAATSPRLAADAADLNGDGVVDILDAYALATRVGESEVGGSPHDFNADGVVDRLDAEVLARRVVLLGDAGPRARHERQGGV